VGVAFLKGQKAAHGSIFVVHMESSTQNTAISEQNHSKSNQGSAGGAKGNMKGFDSNSSCKSEFSYKGLFGTRFDNVYHFLHFWYTY